MPTLSIALGENDDRLGLELLCVQHHLAGVMLFPSDGKKRRIFLQSAAANWFLSFLMAGYLDDRLLSAELLRRVLLVEPRRDQLLADVAQAHTPAKVALNVALHHGEIAGHIILVSFSTYFRHRRSVGRTEAYRILTKWLGQRNSMIGVHERSLQRIWAKYQNVAHLWAAFVLLDRRFPTNHQELRNLLAVSEAVRHWGEQFCPAHSREPLLDGRTTWKTPRGLPLAHEVPITVPDLNKLVPAGSATDR